MERLKPQDDVSPLARKRANRLGHGGILPPGPPESICRKSRSEPGQEPVESGQELIGVA